MTHETPKESTDTQPDHVGKECPNCGVAHDVIESIPDKPLSRTAIASLENSESIEFVRGVEFFSGGLAGPNADEATENIVLSTSSSTKLLSRHAGTGWVVEIEADHEEHEEPEEVGKQIWIKASQELSEAMKEVFNR